MRALAWACTAPVERGDALLEVHVARPDARYVAGVLLASGRRNPREEG
ncbi:hypothetical protein [Streptomyces sp. JH14]